jgi:3-dehydroquinate synthase
MVFEAELAHAAGLLSAAAVERHRRILTSVGLPTSYDGATLAELVEVMGRDKKNRDGHIRVVVLSDGGDGGDGSASTGSTYTPQRLEAPAGEDLQTAYDATREA